MASRRCSDIALVLVLLFLSQGNLTVLAQADIQQLYARADSFLSTSNRDSAVHYGIAGQQILEERGDTSSVQYAKFGYVIGAAYARRYRCEQAQPYLHRAIEILEGKSEQEYELARCYLRSAGCHRDYGTKIAFLEQALATFMEQRDSFHVGLVCLDMGIAHWRIGNIEMLHSLTKQGLEHLEGQEDVDRYLIRLNYSMSRYHRSIANNEAAIYYLQTAHNTLIETDPNDPIHFSIARDLGRLLIEEERYTEAVDVLLKPIRPDTVQKSAHRLNAESDMWFDLGHAYAGLEQYTLAEAALLQGLENVESTYGMEYVYIAYPLNELAEFYLDRGDLEKSSDYLQKYLDVIESHPVQNHPDYGILNMAGARVLQRSGMLEKALERTTAGLAGIGFDVENPSEVSSIYQYDLVADILNERTFVLNALVDSDVAYYDEYRAQVESHIAFLDTLQDRRLDPATHFKILEEHYHVYEKAIDLKWQEYEVTGSTGAISDAFIISEKSKDRVLNRFLLQSRIRVQEDIPPQLLAREEQLNREFAETSVALFNTPESETGLIANLKTRQLELQLEIDQVNNEINRSASGMRLNANINDITSEAIDLTKAETSIIEIFSSETSDNFFVCTDGTIYWHRIPHTSIVPELVTALKDYTNSGDWADKANQIGELLEPVFNELTPNTQHLVLIPDGHWAYIPFEIISVEGSPDSEPVPLIDRFAISYANSIQALRQIESNHTSRAAGLAAFAPDYSSLKVLPEDTAGASVYAELVRSGEYALPGAAAEADAISDLWSGKTYAAEKASKQIFKDRAPDYQVLHLSMHALMEESDPNYSRLVFTQTADGNSDNYLFAAELSRMHLNADLAVLSACNTGTGKVAKGEGVMSLSRAFQYAGVGSTVHSLWKVPDAATAELMVHFYEELKKGNDKATALRNAKLAYRKNALSKELTHPYYWAGFVVHGATDPVDLTTGGAGQYLIPSLIALMAIILVVGWRRKKRKRAEKAA